MSSFWRLFISIFVLVGAVTGCAAVRDGSDAAPACETNLDSSKVHCMYRPGGGTVVWGETGTSDPGAVVSASQGYVTYTLWVNDDGSFGITSIDNVTANSTMDVTVQLEGCLEATMEVVCQPED